MQARITSVGLLIKPDPADTFEYPHHIDRASLDALPAKPGIYIFRGEQDRPLYIGKSVNIRTRVLSHLRAPEEARMLRQNRYIDFRRTAGAQGPRRFDDYSTRTYNGFSTLNAQLGFCQAAARIAKDALTRRQGEFHTLATERLRELRGSLTPFYDSYAFMRMPVRLAPIQLGPPDCSRLRGRERRECQRGG